MDTLNAPALFVLNVLGVLILAINWFGINALIVFGLIGAAILLPTVVSLFLYGAFGPKKRSQ